MSSLGELVISGAALDDWHQVVEWAAEEGWNPGLGDAACFHPTDPAGFFVGRLGSRTVSAISVVNYSDDYAFLGYYLVHPEHRHRGLGLATWNTAYPHAGNRTVGLDAVPAQQPTYARAGFRPVYETVRYAGRPERSAGTEAAAGVVPVTADLLDAVAAYDRHCFPAARRTFLGRWLTAEGHTAYARERDGRLTGYGVVRPAREGYRIGPLFADSRADAEALFDALTAGLDPDVYLDVPGIRSEARALAEGRGLALSSLTVRMYAGPVPEVGPERTYGVTSLELG